MTASSSEIVQELIGSLHGNSITPKQLAQLHFFFGTKLVAALDIIDRGAIKCVVAKPSGRRLWKVGGSNDEYICLAHWCSCQDFAFSVALRREQLYCKHQLAVLIACQFEDGIASVEDITDLQYGALITGE